MAKSGAYSTRSGDKLVPISSAQNCNVIYYSDYDWGKGSDGHFSKVVAWNSNGMPTAIVSKWGNMELIKSTNYDPFKSTGSYGAAKAYYKTSN